MLQFSNPNVYYLGYPTGVSETDLDNAANVARKINERGESCARLHAFPFLTFACTLATALAVSLFKPDPTPSQQTSLDLVGCESSFRGKPCTFAARLIIPLRNAAPVVGATVRFSIHFWTSNVHVEILKAVTDARGRAVGSWTPTSTTAKWGYTSLEATFDGDYDALGVLGASYDWHVAQVFTPVKATFVLPFTCRRGDVIRLEARLKESETGVPVKAGVEVSFKIGTPEIATVSATTDASGAAVVRQYRVPSYVQGSRLTVAAWVINSDDYGNFQTLGNGTITVLPPKLAAKVYVPNVTARRGARTTIKATISSPSGAKLPGMTVIFRVGTLVVGRKVTDSRGVAAVVYTVPKLALLGIKSLSATTVATAKYNAGRGTGKLTVVKA